MSSPWHDRRHTFWCYCAAKAEVAGEKSALGRLTLARFEQTLDDQLARIERSGLSPAKLFRHLSPGRVWLRPKSLSRPTRASDGSLFIGVPPQAKDQPPTAMATRVMLEPHPDFLIHEVLWLTKFGPALESMLAPACVGNRLNLRGSPPEIPARRQRVFRYWGAAYAAFRTDAIEEARQALSQNGRCILLVADLASYYDSIDPTFLVDTAFLDALEASARQQNVPIDREDYVAATNGLLEAIAMYRRDVEHRLGVTRSIGIPIGALTSRLIANLALLELDRQIVANDSIRHYARYVDDLLVVVDVDQDSPTANRSILPRLLPLKHSSTEDDYVLDEDVLRRPGSTFRIQHSKLRVFDLSGPGGLEYLETVAAEMARVSSERRRFLDPQHGTVDDLVAAGDGQEPIRALREADELSLRRLAIGTVCHKVCVAAAMLDVSDAREFSRESLGQVGRLTTGLNRWADYIDVTLRILGAALAAHDTATAGEVVEALSARVLELRQRPPSMRWGKTDLDPGRASGLIAEWLWTHLVEVVCASAPMSDQSFTVELGSISRALNQVSSEWIDDARRLSAADLRMLDREADRAAGSASMNWPVEAMLNIRDSLVGDELYEELAPLVHAYLESCEQSAFGGQPTPVQVFLMSRRPSFVDILLCWIRAERPLSKLISVINAVRGTFYGELPLFEMAQSAGGAWIASPEPPFSYKPEEVRLVLGNLCTDHSWFETSVTQPALTRERQRRLARVLNMAIEASRRQRVMPTMLLLPELAVPRQWQREVCRHVVKHAPMLALAMGLEYDVVGTDLYNEALVLLPRRLGRAAARVWTKQNPARGETAEIEKWFPGYRFGRRRSAERYQTLACEFGTIIPLICSELLEVRARAELAGGTVDLLLVPAWNQDLDTFQSLVHTTALDLHAFVAVANNGAYSDCRVRTPRKESWARDACRLISPGHNEVVTVELPLGKLLEFREDAKAYDQARRNWLDVAKSKKIPLDRCPYPDWKPLPPDMPGSMEDRLREFEEFMREQETESP